MLPELLQPGDTDERCGLLLKDGSIVELENLAENKAEGFIMNPEGMLPFVASDTIEATWHTHPGTDSNLSGEDYEGFLAWPDLEHIIISNEGVRRYRVQDGLVLSCD